MLARTVVVGLVILIGGAASPQPVGPPPLPSAETSLPFVGKQPIHPFVKEASGAISRTLFSGPGPANTTMTVQDVMIGPRSTQQIAALPGPAVIKWLEGHGSFNVGSGSTQNVGDEYQVVPAGQAITIHNPNGPPIGVRLYIFVAGR